MGAETADQIADRGAEQRYRQQKEIIAAVVRDPVFFRRGHSGKVCRAPHGHRDDVDIPHQILYIPVADLTQHPADLRKQKHLRHRVHQHEP